MKDDIDYQLDQVEDVLKLMVDAAEAKALEIAKPFWDRSTELRSDKTQNTTSWFKYSLSVRRETGSPRSPSDRLVIAWKKLKWVQTKNGPKLFSDAVRKKVDGTYALSSFSDAGPEELRLIEAVNSQMQKVWDTLKFVGNTRKTRSNIFRKYNDKD
jgi:hypothetical protein